ncbi:hypothetical protein LCGC14_0337460 [marine sediment metagenome]|uniref:Uncharacterized protein n=1 Tax=marine sediment metagenome TaxID=412755 RepID=A0A0F9TKB5_9ZZZZ
MKVFLRVTDYYQHGEKFEIIIEPSNSPTVEFTVTEISFNNALRNLNPKLIAEDEFPKTPPMKLYQIV